MSDTTVSLMSDVRIEAHKAGEEADRVCETVRETLMRFREVCDLIEARGTPDVGGRWLALSGALEALRSPVLCRDHLLAGSVPPLST